MLKQLYTDQKEYLDYFFDQLDIKSAEQFVQSCLSCKGTIIFSGIGKSGLVAEKIAMTLVSTGTKALFVPPEIFCMEILGFYLRTIFSS